MRAMFFYEPNPAIMRNQQLKDRGFEIVRKIGSGRTRDVYEAIMRRGSLRKVVALKIPNPANAAGSICTMINLSKGDLNEREVTECNDLRHPNLVDIYDVFQIEVEGERYTVTAESFVDGETLEDTVERINQNLNSMQAEKYRKFGKRAGEILRDMRRHSRLEGITDEHFTSYFRQVLDGIGYIHDKGKLHRDIKPSNLLLEMRTNRVIISDLQNTGGIDSIVASNLPTRGGTKFTHPMLLNSLVTGEGAKADQSTDIYSIGATMFYSLSGEAPFDYNVIEDMNGTTLRIGNRTIRVSIVGAGRNRVISAEDHDAILEKKLRMVPKRYRGLLRKCLSFKCSYWDISRLKFDFERATDRRYEELFGKIKKYGLIAGGISAAAAGIAFGFFAGRLAEESKQSVEEILANKDYGYLAVKFRAPTQEDGERLVMLKPYLDSARKRLAHVPDINGIESDFELVAHSFGRHGDPVCNKRVFYSILRSCVVSDPDEIAEEYGDSRKGPVLVPAFWEKFWCGEGNRSHPIEPEDMDRRIYMACSMRYLNACTTVHDDIDDVIARYFCTPREIFDAQRMAECRKGYPSTDIAERGVGKDTGRGDGPTISNGYIAHLPKVKRDLISTAVALYLVTDDDGKLGLDSVPAARASARIGAVHDGERTAEGSSSTLRF
jgi:serine/threonine protein kinase